MQLEVRHEKSVMVVTVINARIDAQVAEEFKNQMFQFISEGNLNILLNISQVSFVDSSGLGVIVASLKQLNGQGQFAICNMNDAVVRMFKLTRMNKIFKLFDSEEEGLNYFANLSTD